MSDGRSEIRLADVGRWSGVAVEASDDELDAICNGIEFREVEPLTGAVENYSSGRLLLYVEFRVHSDPWRLRKHPLNRELEWEGWLNGAFLVVNRFGSHFGRVGILPTNVRRGGVHRMGAYDDQTMLVLVRQISQDGERRWVMRPAEFLCVGLMQRKLFGGLVSDVAENRRAGKPLRVIADREQDLLRLLTGGLSGLGFPSKLPGDVIERSAPRRTTRMGSRSRLRGPSDEFVAPEWPPPE